MPNTNLEIELRNNTVLHVGKYFRSSSSSAEIKTNIHADNLTISGNGVLLASDFNNLPYGATGTAANSAIHANSLTVDSSNVVLDLTRDGSYNCIEVPTPSAFKPINAKSIKLAAETGRWISGLSNDETSLKNAYSAYWNSFPIEADSRLRRVTFGRTATLSGLKLNVGGNSYAKGKTIPDHVVTDDAASKKLSVSFDAGPQWFTTYYLKNKIDLNTRVSIHKDGKFQSDFSIAQMSFGRTNGTLGFTLDVRNLEAGSTYLEAGYTYTVYVQVSPSMNGDYLAESLSGEWTFKTVDEPEDKAITAVGLKQNFYLYEKDDGSTNEPDITISGNSQPYTITDEGSWTTTDGETYTRTVTLKANDGYKFTNSTKVTAVNNDGAKPVDGVNKPTVSEDGSTLSVTITTYKRYTVRFLNGDGTSTGNAAQYIRKEYKATAPDWEAVPSGKVFVGWKQDLNSTSEEAILPGNQTAAITGNTTYYAVLEDAPTHSITLSKLSVDPKVAVGEEATFYLTIENTGNADTGNLTVFFKINSSDHFKFTNDVESVEVVEGFETYTPITEGVSRNPAESELTIPSIEAEKKVRIKLTLPDTKPVGDYGCAVQVKSASGSSTDLKSNIVLVQTTVAKRFIINLYRSTDANPKYSNTWFVGDAVDLDAVDVNTLGALRAHETFTGWTANMPEIVFEDPTAMKTKFVVPYIDTSDDLAITANFVTATVNGIAITQMPKMNYEAGQSFDPDGIEVKLTYSDGTMGDAVDSAALTYEPNTSTALTTANDSVKVSYMDGTDTWSTYLPITVKKPNAQTYTVTYNANGGTGSMNPGTATEGVSFTLPTCTFTPPTGQTFDKWKVGDDTTKYYQPGQSVDIPADTTVTAIWKEIPTDDSVELVPLPTANTGLVYNGSEQTGVNGGTDYTLSGTFEAIDAGTYYAYAKLDGADTSKTYYWEGGTTGLKLIEWTINPASQAAPTGPLEMDSRTTDSITLKTIPGAEYSVDGFFWQSSPEFTGLSSGTSYTFYARYAAKTNYNPSAASDGATFYTLSGSSSSGTGSTTYTVKVLDSKNGSVTADRKTASAGTTVTLTVSPDKGYTLDDLTVLDRNDKEIKLTAKNGKYTFTMPASNVEVEAIFKAAKSGNPFVDVPSGAYYEDAVIWAVEEGVTGGTSATTFDPNGICTRAQAVTFLWRAAGSPAPKSSVMPFADVPAGSYYEQAVLWAVENGITKGTSDTTFGPNATCSRAQIVTFLWRSQKSPAAGSVNPFTDVSADAYYADAVLWAVKESVTSGTTATTFSPNANCTRAQIVTFIYRALAE